jgi:hypothetical protein
MDQTIPTSNVQTADVSQCIETVTGHIVDVNDPQPETIDVTDIAWALSRMPRFIGHTITQIPYNNAQHSVYVAKIVEQLMTKPGDLHDIIPPEVETAIAQYLNHVGQHPQYTLNLIIQRALFHDAAEAYTGDIPSPVKRNPQLRPAIKAIEAKLDDAIFTRLGINSKLHQIEVIVKFGDHVAQAIEGYQFMPSRGVNWVLPKPNLSLIQNFPEPKPSFEAYRDFLDHYEFINDMHDGYGGR